MMRLIRKPIIFCTVGILLNLAIHIYVRSQLVPTPVNLTYKIFDINIKEGSLSVQIDIKDVDTNNLILDAGLPAEFQAPEIHSVTDAVGKPMKYLYAVDKVESHEDVSYSASELAIPLKRGQKFVRIVYRVRIGKKNLPSNPAVRAGQMIPGHISENLGLFYGRNVFLLPRIQIEQVQIQIKPPKKWNIVSTFQESENVGEFLLVSERPKQAIFDAVIGLGKFTEYTKQIDQTVVKIFVGEGCHPHESKIANTAFSIFQSMSGLFGGTGDQYTFIFTPANQEGDNVWTASNSMGFGTTLTMPPTETQWLEVAKNVYSKWEKYSANSLTYSQQDKWLLDGAAIYNSVQILSKQGLLNKERWMLRFYSIYYSMYPYRLLPSKDFYMSKPKFHLDLMSLPESYKSTYWTTKNSTRETVEAKLYCHRKLGPLSKPRL